MSTARCGWFGLTAASLVGSSLVGLSTAHGGGFSSARFGGEHGHPTTDNPTAIYYNPAGLALGTGTRLFVESLLVFRTADYTRPEGAVGNIVEEGESSAGTPRAALSANAGKASLSNFLVSPFLGVASDLGIPNFGAGLAFYAPFGGQGKWDKNKEYEGSEAYPGAIDGVQRWATTEGSLRELYISGAAAYRLPVAGLSFGASFNVIRESLDSLRARNTDGSDDVSSTDGSVKEGRALTETAGTTFSAGVGIIWEPIDSLRIGASYQSQPGFGETSQSGELTLKFNSGASTASKVEFLQELPDVVRLGVSYRPMANLEVRLSGDYTRWSVMQDQCLIGVPTAEEKAASDFRPNNCNLTKDGGQILDGPEEDRTRGVIVNAHRDWKDTFGVRGGGSYWLSDKIELAGSLAYDSSAVPDATIDPSFIDMDKLIAVLGGRFELHSGVLLNASYTHVYYFERTVDTGVVPGGPPTPSINPDHGGTYSQQIGLLNLGVEYQF